MSPHQARLVLLTAAWMESWNDTLGHPEVERHNHASAAQEAGRMAIEVLVQEAYAAGRQSAFTEVGGQLQL